MNAADMLELFGAPIYTYTRAQAIADGELVDVSKMASEAGLNLPVALTRAAWADFVEWTEADTKAKRCPQDEAGRLWDVLWMSRGAMRSAGLECRHTGRPSGRYRFQFIRVPRPGYGRARNVQAVVVIDGNGATIMLTRED